MHFTADGHGKQWFQFNIGACGELEVYVRARHVEDALEALVEYLDDRKLTGVFIGVDPEGEDAEDCYVVGHTTLQNWDYDKGSPAIPSWEWSARECESPFPEGCYADGALGHEHLRERLAELVADVAPETAKSLRGPMPDDAGDEVEALEVLCDRTDMDWDIEPEGLIVQEWE